MNSLLTACTLLGGITSVWFLVERLAQLGTSQLESRELSPPEKQPLQTRRGLRLWLVLLGGVVAIGGLVALWPWMLENINKVLLIWGLLALPFAAVGGLALIAAQGRGGLGELVAAGGLILMIAFPVGLLTYLVCTLLIEASHRSATLTAIIVSVVAMPTAAALLVQGARVHLHRGRR